MTREGRGLRAPRPWTMDDIRARCIEEGECLLWQGKTIPTGFPYAYVEGHKRALRNYVYTVILGNTMPPGCATGVKCKNRLCLSPNCLFAKRYSSIRRETHMAIRANPVTYEKLRLGALIAGHSKLDMARAIEIRASDLSTKELAEQHGVSTWSIAAIRRQATYKPPAVANSVFSLAATMGCA